MRGSFYKNLLGTQIKSKARALICKHVFDLHHGFTYIVRMAISVVTVERFYNVAFIYSRVPNTSLGPNKSVGWEELANLIKNM